MKKVTIQGRVKMTGGKEKATGGDNKKAFLYEAIMQVARQFFIVKGFEMTTVDDITATLGISSDCFYDYFSSTDEILELLWEGY